MHRFSNHEPNMVMQSGNSEAEPRLNREGHMYPAIGSLVAQFRGPNDPALPAYVSLNLQDRDHLAWGGYLGKQYDPFVAKNIGNLFKLPGGLDQQRLGSRQEFRGQLDRLRKNLDLSGSMQASIDSRNRLSISSSANEPRLFSICRASRKRGAIVMATIRGASRPCSPGGWSRRG